MSLVNEAAYLYVHSKELTAVNKELRRLSKKAKKHVEKHARAKTDSKKQKQRKKHSKTTDEMKKLMTKHNQLINRLRKHHVSFIHTLHDQKKL